FQAEEGIREDLVAGVQTCALPILDIGADVSAPKLISVDDHILEPGDLWKRYLPQKYRDSAPRLERLRGDFVGGPRGRWEEGDDRSEERRVGKEGRPWWWSGP